MKSAFRISLGLALFGFILTLFLSLSNNIFSTSLIRALMSGGLLFLVGIAVQWILRLIAEPGNPLPPIEPPTGRESIGRTLDLSTPDEQDELNRIIRQSETPPTAEAAFEPLHPPKLTTKTDQKAQDLADALRTMTEK